MVNRFLKEDTVPLLSNFNLDREKDRRIYELIEKILDQSHAGKEDSVKKFLEEHPPENDPQGDDAYSMLERRYLDAERGFNQCLLYIREFRLALLALDYQFSMFVGIMQHEYTQYDRPGVESLSEFCTRLEVSNCHRFARPIEMMEKQTKPQLRLVKG